MYSLDRQISQKFDTGYKKNDIEVGKTDWAEWHSEIVRKSPSSKGQTTSNINSSIHRLTKDGDRGAVNANKLGRMILVAAYRVLLAVVISSEYRIMWDLNATYHLLPAAAMTEIGVQVRPIGMSASMGIPRLATILALCGLLEPWTLLQHNWSEVLHWPEL